MPEPIKPAAEPQPVDTEDIIRKSIASIREPGDDPPEDEVEEQPVDAVAAVEPVAGTEQQPPADSKVVEPDAAAVAATAAAKALVDKTPVDELDISKVPARTANGRVNAIPQPRVVKMVEKSVEKAKTEWSEKTLKPVQEKVTAYETRLQAIAGTEDMMFGTKAGKPLPEAESMAAKRLFLSQLATAVPGYAEILKGVNLGSGDTKAGEKEAVSTRNAAEDPEPKPDVIEGGVAVGWTEKGLSDLRAWDRREAVRNAAAATEAALVKKYGLDRMSGRFTEVEDRRQSLSDIERQIDTASASWRGFNENAQAILGALQANTDPTYSLRHAYEEVLFGLATRKATDEKSLEDAMRTRITAELAKAPRSTSAGADAISTRAAEDVPTTGDPVEDAIRRSIRGLK